MKMKTYMATVVEVQQDGTWGRSWNYEIPRNQCRDFSVDFAKGLIDFANEKYPEISGENAKFNYVGLKMDGREIGLYWAGKNLLRIYESDVLLYEDNNGIIYRDGCYGWRNS